MREGERERGEEKGREGERGRERGGKRIQRTQMKKINHERMFC